MKKKTIAIALACAVLLCCVVGGTMAWLTDSTPTVTNTFTVGDIKIGLTETGAADTDDTTEGILDKAYHFVPGDTLPKDPTVKVFDGSEACYVFVKVMEENNTHDDLGTGKKIINFAIADGWIPVDGHTGYYYRLVDSLVNTTSAAGGVSYSVLQGNAVTVNVDVTKEMVTDINDDQPKLSFKAAAIQQAHTSVTEAWERLPEEFKA